MAEAAIQDDDEKKSDEDTPEPEEYDNQFDPFHVIAITGSYLGQSTDLNQVKQILVTNAADINNNNSNDNKHNKISTKHIDTFNTFQGKKYSKLNKSLLSKKPRKLSNDNDNNKADIANIWDRQYCSFCIAKNVSYKAIQNYAYSIMQSQKTDDDDQHNDDNKDIDNDNKQKCDVLIKCGGCYAINPAKTSSFCDGYILNDSYNNNTKLFPLPSLEVSRSNCSSIYDESIGIICYGGRSKSKSLLNSFEVLNIENNDIEWNMDLIPSTTESRSRHPSMGIYNDLLFICGGRGIYAMNSCEYINLSKLKNNYNNNNNDNNSTKWDQLSPMNYSRSFGSNIINWNQYNSLIVMGGYGSFHAEFYAEKYDLNKNKWHSFPKCNFPHKYNPCIKLIGNSNNNKNENDNQLLVVLCDKRTKSNLGIIEIFDGRMDKWMKCKISTDQLLQFHKKQELRRLLYF